VGLAQACGAEMVLSVGAAISVMWNGCVCGATDRKSSACSLKHAPSAGKHAPQRRLKLRGDTMDATSRSRALYELADIAVRNHVWRALAFYDIRSRYRFSVLGTGWVVMSTAVTAVSVGLIYGQFFGLNVTQYLPYFTAGLIVWTFIASALNEASTTLIAAGSLIKGTRVPISLHVMRMLQRNFLIFLHNLVILGILWLAVPWPLDSGIISALFGLVLLYVFLIGASVIIAFVCVRYRDIPPMIAAGTQFLFLASPILWHEDHIRHGAEILVFNPVTYFLRVVRDPLLGQSVPLSVWGVAAALTGASVGLAALVYVTYRNRIAYWV
jgi:lipopolysaccharide transport system permease protein